VAALLEPVPALPERAPLVSPGPVLVWQVRPVSRSLALRRLPLRAPRR